MDINISRDEENKLIDELCSRGDTEAKRILRYYDMPDLSRTPGSPIHEIVERVKAVPSFKNFDIIEISGIVAV